MMIEFDGDDSMMMVEIEKSFFPIHQNSDEKKTKQNL